MRAPWPKIAAALAVLFVISGGAGYAVGAQVQHGADDQAAVAPPTQPPPPSTAATTAPATDAPTTEPPTTEPTTTEAPTTEPPTTEPPTTEAPTTTTEPGPRRPDRDHPLRVVMAGDSVMAGLAPPVKAAIGGDGTADVRFLLTPSILRDPTVRFTWNQQLEEFDPEVIVMFVGTWESGVIQSSGAGLPVDDPNWKAQYERNVLDPWVQLITSRGAHVIWLGNPIVKNDDANHLFGRLNEAFRELPGRWPSVTYVESNPALNGASPGYHDIVPLSDGTLLRTRQTDGLHLCADGAALLGKVVSQVIVDGFKANLSAGWEKGPWRFENVYPPASCPPA